MKRKIFLFFAIVSVVVMLAISGCGKEKVYRITFDANGGSGEMSDQIIVAKDNIQKLILNTYTRDGYIFVGWNTMPNGSGDIYFDGQDIYIFDDIVLYAQWNKFQTTGQLNGHYYVDLGLPSGLLWATCNVGASSPDGYGDYYAWAETYAKNTYTWENYKYRDEHYEVCSKYSAQFDNLTILEACDDAATANWGAGWRMPTADEMQELKDNCKAFAMKSGQTVGILLTGPNGNSIFLPAGNDSSIDYSTSYYIFGSYWSSSLYVDSLAYVNLGTFAYYLSFGIDTNYGYYSNKDIKVNSGGRSYGQLIRPVYNSSGESGNVTPPNNPVASPTASFNINSSNGNYAPTTIQCNNTSTNAVTYKWTLTKPDYTSVTSTLKNPSFTCSQTGTYTLELIAYNSNNVSSTNTQTITLVTPSTYTITYLKLQQIPMLASDNSSWDTGFFDGADPDIFFTILDSNGTILYTSSTKSNTSETSLPVTWNGVNLTLDYSSNYTIRFYDSDDGIDDNDLMAGCNFISSYLTPGNNSYTWTGQTNGTKFTVGLRW